MARAQWRYWKVTIKYDNKVKLPNGRIRIDKDSPREYIFYGPPSSNDVQTKAMIMFNDNYPGVKANSIKVEATDKPK